MASGLTWRIYYADGSTFSSDDGTPHEAPGLGALIIVQCDKATGRMIMQGWDFFYWVPSENQWWGSDMLGVLDRLTHRLEVEALLWGRMVSRIEWGNTMKGAKDDPDFPIKSGTRPGESP